MEVRENNRIVVRIEISTLFDQKNGKFSLSKMERLAMLVSNLHNSGKELLIVSSGAIALGSEKLKIPVQTEDITLMQATAAIGQAELIKTYQRYFDEFHQTVAQVLITQRITENKERFKNAQNTFNSLIEMNMIPIINENDVVSTSDIELDDNYPVALTVADLAEANTILIKTDKDEVFYIVQRGVEKAMIVNSENELFDALDKICHQERNSENSEKKFPATIADVF